MAKVVDYNDWREHTVMYDEYQALLRYGHCMSSSTFIAMPDGTGVPDLDVGFAVREMKLGPTDQRMGKLSQDPLRNKRLTVQIKRGRLV